jgi:cytochrome b561
LPSGRGRRLRFGIAPADPQISAAAPAPPASDAFKFRWDVLLFCGFVLTTAPDATGIPLHEWVGLVLILVLVVHLALNWTWIVGATRQMFARLPGEVRLNHILDSLLFVFMTLTMVSGVLVSRSALRTLGLTPRPDAFWDHVHGIFGNIVIVLVGVHVAMHVRWIVSKMQRNRRPAAGQ